jgi:hypothetical protein
MVPEKGRKIMVLCPHLGDCPRKIHRKSTALSTVAVDNQCAMSTTIGVTAEAVVPLLSLDEVPCKRHCLAAGGNALRLRVAEGVIVNHDTL